MNTVLKTRKIDDIAGIRDFFDEIADQYQEAHGKAEQMLCYRLSVIQPLLGNKRRTLLEIGCGKGLHLFHLAPLYQRSIGTDLSPNMIKIASVLREQQTGKENIRLYIDRAEQLTSIADREIDTVLCVGAFEHMIDKAKVLSQVNRVLGLGGEFICLMPNADFCWYRAISAWFKMETKHLSSDRFLTRNEINEMLTSAGLELKKSGYWRFIPRGDMPVWIFVLLQLLEQLGRICKIPAFRGGLFIKAVKPFEPEYPADE